MDETQIQEATETVAVVEEVTARPLVHYEHPEKLGGSWCGASVWGIYTEAALDCVVCADLWEVRWQS